MNMDEPIEEIKAFFRDRNSSPLGGAFAVAWLLWNWKIVLILISTIPLESKFNKVSEQFSESDWCIEAWPMLGQGEVIAGLLIPGAIAFAYITLYPLLAIPAYGVSLGFQAVMQWVRLKIEGLEPISREEAKKLRNRLNVEFAEKEAEVEEAQEKIRELNKTIVDLQDQHASDGRDLDERIAQLESERAKLTGALEETDTLAEARLQELESLRLMVSDKEAMITNLQLKMEEAANGTKRPSDGTEVKFLLGSYNNLKTNDFTLAELVGESFWKSLEDEARERLAVVFDGLILDRGLPVRRLGKIDEIPAYAKIDKR